MNKQEFLTRLKNGLSGLPKEDIEERLKFYEEMIDDKIEEGIPEESAVSEIGSIDELISQITADNPLPKIEPEELEAPRKLKLWEIILLILGSPIWVSLLLAVAAVVISVFAVVWCVIITLWAVFISLAFCGLGLILGGIIFVFKGLFIQGAATFGAGLICVAISIFMFFVSLCATLGILGISKKFYGFIKNKVVNKEVSK